MSLLLFAGMTTPLVAYTDEESTKETSKTAQSVEVTIESSSEKEDDSAPKTSVKGRIVILGPDGKRQEFDLSESLSDGARLNINDVPHLLDHIDAEDAEPRYLIGVICTPAGDLLRRHLKLTDRGLLASQISEGLPAAEAGIQEGDILLAVGEQKLNFVQDLIKVVSDSAGKEITIELLRDGDRISVAVTPRKLAGKELRDVLLSHTDLWLQDPDSNEEGITSVLSQIEDITSDTESPRILLRRFGPGIRLDDEGGPQQRQQILKLIQNMVNKQDSHAAEVEVATEALPDDNELSLKVLRQQIEQLRKQIRKLEKQIGNADAE